MAKVESHTLYNPCCEDEMDAAFITFTVVDPRAGERSMVKVVTTCGGGVTDYFEPRLLNRVEARKVWANVEKQGWTRGR